MPSQNEIVIAAAGGGKTTRIVRRAIGDDTAHSALVTYTRNNLQEIERKLFAANGTIPSRIEVWSWFSFLLRELARPYQSALHDRRIENICWMDGRSSGFAGRANIAKFYFSRDQLIYSDKLAQFVVECNKTSKGAVIRRLEQRFSCIYIDEIQDMAGYDIDVLELILRSRIRLVLVGDHRQATYRTNYAARNKACTGIRIIDKFKEWRNKGLTSLTYECETHRCNQTIATFADGFFPNEPATISLNTVVTGHDGVFSIQTALLHDYMSRYSPQVLRLDKTTPCAGYDSGAMNYGESKGLTFDRVIIFPHKKAYKWLSSGLLDHVANSAAKMYVGTTRARHSVAFVYDGVVGIPGIQKLDAIPI